MSSQPPPRGHVRFYAHCAPPLTASDAYVLQVDQAIRDDIANVDVGGSDLKQREFRFAVTGPRFTLDASEIHAAYPPANAEGPFDTRLPMVVLRRRTLPWERELSAAGGDTAGDITPWLALLLFEEHEIKLLDPPNCTLGTILNGDSSENVPALTVPGGASLDRSQPCLGIQVSKSKFKEVAPTLEELRLLAHARQVNTDDKELLGQDKDGWFSVVVANRLPEPNKKYVACLVSLEGHEGDLPAADFHQVYTGAGGGDVNLVFPGVSAAIRERMALRSGDLRLRSGAGDSARANLTATAAGGTGDRLVASAPVAATGGGADVEAAPAGAGSDIAYADSYNWGLEYNPSVGDWQFQPVPSLRFATLARWSFSCTGEGDFEGLMRALPYRGGIGMLGMAKDQTIAAGGTPPFRVATDSGHTPLRLLSRAGEEMTAFYRGPLAPAGVNRDPNGPYHCADQARRIDPLTGLENLGYAAAFEIGRLLALSDANFALALLRWRRAGYRRVVAGINGALLQARLGTLLPDQRLDLLMDPGLLVQGLFADIGGEILNTNLLGGVVDPTGLLNIRDRAAGFDAARVVAATGFESGLINALLAPDVDTGGVGLEGVGQLLGATALVEPGMLENNFDTLVGMTESAFAHLDLEREQTLSNVNANLNKGVQP